MTAERTPAGPLDLQLDGVTATLVAEGAALQSVRARGSGGDVELLARTPWAGETWGSFRMPTSEAQWHLAYPGGWHPLIPRPLGPWQRRGVEHPFHGEAAWRTWSLTRVSATDATASVALRSLPVAITRTISLVRRSGDVVLLVSTELHNLGLDPVAFGWVEHPVFDGALLADSGLTLGSAPLALSPSGSAFTDNQEAVGLLRIDAAVTRGLVIELRWPTDFFPRVYVWEERRATRAYPWWGMVDAVGIEPASQPHDLAEEEPDALTLAPGETMAATIELLIHRPEKNGKPEKP